MTTRMKLRMYNSTEKLVSIILSLALDANRERNNFEKDVDNLFFSGMAPPARRKRGQDKPTEGNKPPATTPPPEQKKPVAPVETKKQPEPTVKI